jgi:lysophospholipase L1-like esterase
MNPLKYWSIEEFEISSFRYGLNGRKNNHYYVCGSDNSKKCKYSYNELGFRGDSPTKNGFKIMSIGCSMTEGVGVNDNETWASRFSKIMPNGVDLNFGISGRSNDYISRCLLSYYDYVKPDLVIILYTFLNRREIYTENNKIEPFIASNPWGFLEENKEGEIIYNNLTEIQNRNEDIINWHKNHLIITQFLKLNNCNYIWNGGLDVPTEYTDAYRFDGDFINFLDLGVDGGHPGPKHNQTFATKLLNHINDNFPHFIFKKNNNDNDFIIKNII